MLNSKFSPWPCFSEEEQQAVARVLASNRVNYWTGQECREFEREFAEWTGAKYAIALTNGTVALDLALQGLGVGSGDEVVVTPRTFIASVSSVVNAGATPVFADIDGDSGNITAETIKAVLTDKTKAIIPVHLAGWPCDMDAIMALANDHGLYVIEDCAQAHGAQYKGKSVGTIGHVGAWSFCQDKIMTTGGEGGMVTCNDRETWSKMWSFKDHGKSWEAVYEREHAPGFRWLHKSIGTNWRMLEMQAAIGRIQLAKMPEWNALRRRNADILRQAFAPFAGDNGFIHMPQLPKGDAGAPNIHAEYKFYVYVRPDMLPKEWDRDRIVTEISEQGIPCFQGSCSEVYLEKAFDGMNVRPEQPLPMAKQLGETSLMFLVHPVLTEDEMHEKARVIGQVLGKISD